FDAFFAFKDEKAEEKHEAAMVSLGLVSEIYKVMDGLGLNKKEFAEKIGKSPSYVTQLFNGTKLINCPTLALIQRKLGVQFQTKAVPKELVNCEGIELDKKWGEQQINDLMERFKHPEGAWIYKKKVWAVKDAQTTKRS